MELFGGLQQLGLAGKEAKVYLALLELEQGTAGEISRRTGIHRRSCYDALNALQEKGLVSYAIVEGTKSYRATTLDSFRALVREREALVEELLPLLKERKKGKQEEPVIEIFRGIKSVKSVFEDLLRNRGTIHIYGGHNPARIYLKYYYPKFTKIREKLGIMVRALHTDVAGIRKFAKSLPLWDARFIDNKMFSPSFWWVQGNRVFIVFWGKEPIVMRLTDKNLAKTYLGSFNMMWKVAKK